MNPQKYEVFLIRVINICGIHAGDKARIYLRKLKVKNVSVFLPQYYIFGALTFLITSHQNFCNCNHF